MGTVFFFFLLKTSLCVWARLCSLARMKRETDFELSVSALFSHDLTTSSERQRVQESIKISMHLYSQPAALFLASVHPDPSLRRCGALAGVTIDGQTWETFRRDTGYLKGQRYQWRHKGTELSIPTHKSIAGVFSWYKSIFTLCFRLTDLVTGYFVVYCDLCSWFSFLFNCSKNKNHHASRD